MYQLRVTVILTFLDFRIIVAGAYLLLLNVGIPNVLCGCNFGRHECHVPFRVTLTLTTDLVCRVIVSRTYLIYYLRWESQRCVDASGDAGVLCTMYGSL